jgi:hypothetical protein
MRFAIFPLHLSKVLRLPRKSDARSYKVLHCQLPKTVRHWGALHILTCKCASRQNGSHFFHLNFQKWSLRPSVFYTFDFEMCFAPQRRPLFVISTSKSAPRMVCIIRFDFEMCFAPPMPATRTHISYLQDVTQRAANKAPPADPLSNLPRKQEAFATRSGTIFHLAWTSSLHRLVGGSQTESLVKTLM